MQKWYWIILLALLLVAGLFVIVWQTSTEDYPPAYAIPDNQSILIKENLTPENVEHFSNVFLQPLFTEHQHLTKADSQFNAIIQKIAESPAGGLFAENSAYISLHPTASRRFDPLLVIENRNKITEDIVEDFLNEHFDGLRMSGRTFSDERVFDVRDADHNDMFSFATPGGLFIISSSTVLVEDAINTLRRNINIKSKKTQIIHEDKAGQNFFIDFMASANLLRTIFDDDDKLIEKREIFRNMLGGYDLSFNENGFTFTGKTVSTDNFSDFFNILSNEDAIEQTIARKIPGRTGFYISFGLTDYMRWQQAWGESDEASEYEHAITLDGLQDLGILMGNQWLTGLYEPPSPDYSSRLFIAAKLDADASPEEWAAANAELLDEKGMSPDSSDYRGHTLQRFALTEEKKHLFSPLAPVFSRPWFTFHNDLLLIAPNRSHLERMLRDLDNNNTLDQVGRYRSYEDQMLSRANIGIYFNPRRLSQVPPYFLRDKPEKFYREHDDIFKKIRHAGFQLAGSGDGFYSRGFAETSTDIEERSELLWSATLDEDVQAGPYVVTNHEDNSKELLLQDNDDRLILMDGSGNTEWNTGLPGKIQGDVEQIDLYGNDRLQYLFTTENYIHLIDRNGSYVANYPISLSNPTRHGLTLYKVPGSNDYRYFVPTSNDAIYGYRGDGRPLGGWSPKRINGELMNPVKYLVFQGTFHLLAACDDGYLYIMNLQSNDISGPFDKGTLFHNEIYASFGDERDETYIFSSDSSGKIHRFPLEGDRDTLDFGEKSFPHHFNYMDFTGNDEGDFIFTHDGVMEVYSENATRLRNYTLINQPQHPVSFFEYNGETAFGYIDESTSQVYLHDHDGNVLHGFPVKGEKPLRWSDLNGDGHEELITASDNEVLIYRVR